MKKSRIKQYDEKKYKEKMTYIFNFTDGRTARSLHIILFRETSESQVATFPHRY
jgi:hypothetical protein